MAAVAPSTTSPAQAGRGSGHVLSVLVEGHLPPFLTLFPSQRNRVAPFFDGGEERTGDGLAGGTVGDGAHGWNGCFLMAGRGTGGG